MKRLSLALLACAAACSIYGSNDDVTPPLSPPIGPTADASDAATADETALANDPPVSDEAGSVSDVNAPPADAGADQGGPALPDLLVFITSTTTTGKIGTAGGALAGDRICEDLGLRFSPRRFRAWLSDSGESAKQHVIDHAVGRRYRRVDQALVAEKAEDMLNGLLVPIAIDERGISWASDTSIWTGASYSGGITSSTCLSWYTADPAKYGMAAIMTSSMSWGAGSPYSCDVPRHLYCFEVP